MAVRPVYTVDSGSDSSALYTVTNPNFKYYCGLAKIQRQRSYESLHQAYHDICPDVKILEVSTVRIRAGLQARSFQSDDPDEIRQRSHSRVRVSGRKDIRERGLPRSP